MRERAVCRAAARAPCCGWRDRRSATYRGCARATRRRCRRCATLAAQYPRYGYRQDPDLPGAAGPCDECRIGPIGSWRQAGCRCRGGVRAGESRPVGRGRCRRTASESCLGVRLRVRHVRERPHAEMPDGHRRVHARVSGDRRRRQHSIGRVIEVLAQLVSVHGAPRYLRSDNGSEFVATAMLRWVATRRSRPRSSIRASPGRMAPTNRSTGSSATSV